VTAGCAMAKRYHGAGLASVARATCGSLDIADPRGVPCGACLETTCASRGAVRRARSLCTVRGGRRRQHCRAQFTSSKNGLTVILSEGPFAAGWWPSTSRTTSGRGSRPARRTGFAHLFEHLMFMGRSGAPTGSFDPMDGGRRRKAQRFGRAKNPHRLSRGRAQNELALLLWLEADRLRDLVRS